jgi:hypothetical protein
MQFITNHDKKKNKDKEQIASSLDCISHEENLKIKIELSSTKDETQELIY